jgi:hypothetical protein
MTGTNPETLQAAEPRIRDQRRRVWLRAQPLDLSELEARGIIERRATLYKILDSHRLPESAAVQMSEDCWTDCDGSVLVCFPLDVTRSQTLAESIGVDWRGPQPE